MIVSQILIQKIHIIVFQLKKYTIRVIIMEKKNRIKYL